MNALALSIIGTARGFPAVAMPIETIDLRRLILRRPAEEDIVPLTALADNIHIAAKLPDMPHPYTIADAGRFLRRLGDGRGRLTAFGVIERDSDKLVGCCKIEADGTDGECRIGFWIGEPHWGKGYMTEAAQGLVDHAFSSSARLAAIRADIRPLNPAARRVLEKCGFQYAGPGTQTDIRQGCLVPVDHYRIDRGIWSAIKGWARTSVRESARHLAG